MNRFMQKLQSFLSAGLSESPLAAVPTTAAANNPQNAADHWAWLSPEMARMKRAIFLCTADWSFSLASIHSTDQTVPFYENCLKSEKSEMKIQ